MQPSALQDISQLPAGNTETAILKDGSQSGRTCVMTKTPVSSR